VPQARTSFRPTILACALRTLPSALDSPFPFPSFGSLPLSPCNESHAAEARGTSRGEMRRVQRMEVGKDRGRNVRRTASGGINSQKLGSLSVVPRGWDSPALRGGLDQAHSSTRAYASFRLGLTHLARESKSDLLQASAFPPSRDCEPAMIPHRAAPASGQRHLPLPLPLLLLLTILCVSPLAVLSQSPPLSTGFYDASCPKAKSIIAESVKAAVTADVSLSAQILRLAFHDCFGRVGTGGQQIPPVLSQTSRCHR